MPRKDTTLSEYPYDHQLYKASNRKALGYFKDELNSIPMEETVGLRPKCYAFLCTGKVDRNVVQHTKPVEKKTAKGAKRKVKEEHLHFEHYLNALRNFESFICKQNSITSTAHTVRPVHQRKIGSYCIRHEAVVVQRHDTYAFTWTS